MHRGVRLPPSPHLKLREGMVCPLAAPTTSPCPPHGTSARSSCELGRGGAYPPPLCSRRRIRPPRGRKGWSRSPAAGRCWGYCKAPEDTFKPKSWTKKNPQGFTFRCPGKRIQVLPLPQPRGWIPQCSGPGWILWFTPRQARLSCTSSPHSQGEGPRAESPRSAPVTRCPSLRPAH